MSAIRMSDKDTLVQESSQYDDSILDYFKGKCESHRAVPSSSSCIDEILEGIQYILSGVFRGSPDATVLVKQDYLTRCMSLYSYSCQWRLRSENADTAAGFDSENKLISKIEGVFFISLRELLFNERLC